MSPMQFEVVLEKPLEGGVTRHLCYLTKQRLPGCPVQGSLQNYPLSVYRDTSLPFLVARRKVRGLTTWMLLSAWAVEREQGQWTPAVAWTATCSLVFHSPTQKQVTFHRLLLYCHIMSHLYQKRFLLAFTCKLALTGSLQKGVKS